MVAASIVDTESICAKILAVATIYHATMILVVVRLRARPQIDSKGSQLGPQSRTGAAYEHHHPAGSGRHLPPGSGPQHVRLRGEAQRRIDVSWAVRAGAGKPQRRRPRGRRAGRLREDGDPRPQR